MSGVYALLLEVVQQPQRSAVEAYVKEMERAFKSVKSHLGREELNSWGFRAGQVDALLGIGRRSRIQKVPDEVIATLASSKVRTDVLQELVGQGRMRLSELAERLDKQVPNLVAPTRELAALGLLEREEFGKHVWLSALPLATAALEELSGIEPVRRRVAVAAAGQHCVGGLAGGFAYEGPADIEEAMHEYILAGAYRVFESGRTAQAGIKAAQREAMEFKRRFPAAVRELDEQTLRNIVESDKCYFAGELLLLGREPIIYLPEVLRRRRELDTAQYFRCIGEMLNAGVSLGTISMRTHKMREQKEAEAYAFA